jgi:hypothetical protein
MVVAPDLPMTMRVYAQNGDYICEFPYFTNLQVQDTINAVGAFTFDWNLNSPGASSLISDSALQMAVCMDTGNGSGFVECWRGWYEQDTYDPSNNESAIVQASGRSMVAILDQAVVFPQGGLGNTTTSWSFTGASAGTIMNTLLVAAQSRGCFPDLAWSFTDGQDSSGNAWAQGYTNAFSAGTSYLDLLTGLAAGGLCDFNMTGMTLNIYNPMTTLAQDFSSTVVLRRSRDIVTISAQRDRTQIGTAMLAIGDNGVNVEVDSSTLGTLGRYEVYLAQSGVTDTATLMYFADQALAAIDDQQLSYTPTDTFQLGYGSPVPWRDFSPGDYISIDYAGTPVKFRATTWTVQAQPGGPTMFQPTLNDVFYSREVLIQNQISSLNGGTVTGIGGVAINSGSPVSGPNPTVPDIPAFDLANCFTASYFSPATGTTLAQLELQWDTPGNTNGTPIIDGSNYLVQYRLSATPIYPLLWSQVQGKAWSLIQGNPWSNILDTPQNQQWTTVQVNFDDNNVIIGGLICGETYDFQIACTDVSGNTGAFSSIQNFLTATDSVAPGQPDAPEVFSSMVAVQVLHDLQLDAGGPLPQDLDHLEVHYSYDPAFVPQPGIGSVTYLGKMIATAGMINAGIVAMGNFNVTSTDGIYIKVIAVDTSGNSSAPSPGSGVTATLIDNEHISSLSVTKLTAGTISADIILGAVIATAFSGQRVQMDSSGLSAYDVNGNEIFSLSDASPVIVLGANGISGNSIKIDTSQTYPTITWEVTGSATPAFINALNEGAGITGLGINMGQYLSGIDGETASQRIYLQGVGGMFLECIDANQLTHGSSLILSDLYSNLTFDNHGNQINGGIYFDINGGLTDTAVTIEGYVSTFSIDPGSWIVQTVNNYTAGSGTFSVSYGVTMLSTTVPMVQYACGNTSVVPALSVNAYSTTGYSLTLSAATPAAFTVFTSSFRHN